MARATRIGLVLLIAASGIGAGPAAAQTRPGASPNILVNSRRSPAPDTAPDPVGLVRVEVVVTDPHQGPVTGLPEAAFSLEEDGRPQRLVSFQAVDLPRSGGSEAAASAPPRVSTNIGDTSPSPARRFVIAFDDLHLGAEGAVRARELCQQFLEGHTRPGDQVTVVAPGEELVASATMPGGRAELTILTRALRGRRPLAAAVTDDEARQRRHHTLGVLATALEVLPGIGPRTSVLLVSEGFLYEPGDSRLYTLIAASQRANATFHFLDVRGPAGGGGRVPPRAGRGKDARGEPTGAEILSTLSGGQAVHDWRDPAAVLEGLSREASHYYVLGYRPAGERRGGQLRRIRVAVSRRDVTVRARRGFYEAPDTADPEKADLPGRLRDALESSFPVREIPLRVTALAGAPTPDGQVRVTVASEVAAQGLKLARLPDRTSVGRVEAVMEVRHQRAEGGPVTVRERLVLRVPRGVPVEEAWLPFRRSFTLPPGRGQVRLAVRDRDSGAIGTVVHPLDVPDPARSRVSSPILSDVPGGDGVRPPRIVARRGFATGSILYCYFEVYPGPAESAPAPPRSRSAFEIVDRQGRVRLRGALPPPVSREDGGLGRLVEIPLTRLEPGDYELVLDLGGEAGGGLAELREAFSVAKPRRFDDDVYRGALSAYLEGDVARAIKTLLPWPARDILATAQRLPRDADGLRETALLLHTDLALLLRRHAHEGAAENHLRIGRALVEASRRPDLRREWLLALASAHQASSQPAEALALYTECAEAFPEDGESRLGAGTLYEARAFLPPGFPRGNLNVRPRQAARKAERWYREALRVQPSATEARLRLARVLQNTGRGDEALAHLSQVVESDPDPALGALARLFWGEICETRGDVDEALEHYRAALAADGDLQVAALAVAQILQRRDGLPAAFDALEPALGEGAGRSPLLLYRQGPRRLGASPLGEMRSRLASTAGVGP